MEREGAHWILNEFGMCLQCHVVANGNNNSGLSLSPTQGCQKHVEVGGDVQKFKKAGNPVIVGKSK